jgi:hypothetical protein
VFLESIDQFNLIRARHALLVFQVFSTRANKKWSSPAAVNGRRTDTPERVRPSIHNLTTTRSKTQKIT